MEYLSKRLWRTACRVLPGNRAACRLAAAGMPSAASGKEADVSRTALPFTTQNVIIILPVTFSRKYPS